MRYILIIFTFISVVFSTNWNNFSFLGYGEIVEEDYFTIGGGGRRYNTTILNNSFNMFDKWSLKLRQGSENTNITVGYGYGISNINKTMYMEFIPNIYYSNTDDYGLSFDISIGLTKYKQKNYKQTYPFGVNISSSYTAYSDLYDIDIVNKQKDYFEINLESEKMHYPIIAIGAIAAVAAIVDGYDGSDYDDIGSSSYRSCSPYNYRDSNDACPENASYRSETCNQYIKSRDNYTCQCNCGEHSADIHVDHIYPESLGGSHGASNLQVLCSRHNLAKSNSLTYSCD